MADHGLGLYTISAPLRDFERMDSPIDPAGVEQLGVGTTLLFAAMFGTAAGGTPIPKRWNPGTSTWDVIPGP